MVNMAEFAARAYTTDNSKIDDIPGYALDTELSGRDGKVWVAQVSPMDPLARTGHPLDTPRVVVAFRGTKYASDWPINVASAVGMADKNPWCKTDEALYQKVLDKYKPPKRADGSPENVSVTGHSAGGLIATELNKKYGVDAWSYNPHIPLLNARDFTNLNNRIFVSGHDPVSALSVLLPHKAQVFHVPVPKGRSLIKQHDIKNFL